MTNVSSRFDSSIKSLAVRTVSTLVIDAGLTTFSQSRSATIVSESRSTRIIYVLVSCCVFVGLSGSVMLIDPSTLSS